MNRQCRDQGPMAGTYDAKSVCFARDRSRRTAPPIPSRADRLSGSGVNVAPSARIVRNPSGLTRPAKAAPWPPPRPRRPPPPPPRLAPTACASDTLMIVTSPTCTGWPKQNELAALSFWRAASMLFTRFDCASILTLTMSRFAEVRHPATGRTSVQGGEVAHLMIGHRRHRVRNGHGRNVGMKAI